MTDFQNLYSHLLTQYAKSDMDQTSVYNKFTIKPQLLLN